MVVFWYYYEGFWILKWVLFWIFLVVVFFNVVVYKMLISDGFRGVVVLGVDYKFNCFFLYYFDGVNV